MSSLRGPKQEEPDKTRKPKSYRFPDDVILHLRTAKKQLNRTETDIIVGAVRTDRDLVLELGKDYEDKFKAWAAQLGLSLDANLAKALAAAVRRAVDCQGVDCKPNAHKYTKK